MDYGAALRWGCSCENRFVSKRWHPSFNIKNQTFSVCTYLILLVSACMAWIRWRLSIRDIARGPKQQVWAKSPSSRCVCTVQGIYVCTVQYSTGCPIFTKVFKPNCVPRHLVPYPTECVWADFQSFPAMNTLSAALPKLQRNFGVTHIAALQSPHRLYGYLSGSCE